MSRQASLALVSAGLWEKEVLLMSYHDIKWHEVYRLATEQSVLGLVLAGLVHSDVKPPQVLLLQWIGEVHLIEQQNKAMNEFVAQLIERLRNENVYAILVKGQGVAQCYERPLWRACGDIDLLLSDINYERAKELLIPIAVNAEPEDKGKKHLGLYIKDFLIELHGSMPFGLSKKVDGVLDEVIDKANTGNTNATDDLQGVVIPRPDEHVLIVFTHFLHHFFIEGVGLRQICDWCRLLYTYKDSLNYGFLESRIRKMGLMSEWKAFYNLASRYLGMQDLDSRFMFHDSRFDKQADRIMELVLESGNFGHNKDLSYRSRYSGMTYKIVAAWRRLKDFATLIPVFPLDAPRFFVVYLLGKKMEYAGETI